MEETEYKDHKDQTEEMEGTERQGQLVHKVQRE